MGLQAQGNGGQGVGEQVNEQQVDRRKGHGQAQQGGIQNGEDTRHVAGQQELDGPADVGIDVSAVLHRLNDGGKVVVGEDHAGGVLGHLGAGDAHGHADVGLLQGGGIVDAVAGHGNQGATVLPGPDDADLMLGGHTGVNGDLGNEGTKLLVGHGLHNGTLHGLGAGGEDTNFTGDGGSGDDVVAGNHDGADAGGDTVGNGLLGFLSGGVHHGDEAQEVELLFVGQGDLGAFQGAAAKGQHTKALVGEVAVGRLDLLPLLGAQAGAVQHHVHSALGHHHDAAGEPVDGGHELTVGVEGQLAQAGPGGADLVLFEAEILTQTDQSGLGGVTDLVDLAGLLVGGDGGIAAQEGRTEEGLLGGVLEVCLGGGDDLAVDIELADGHAVLGQGAGLVGADDGHAAQAFHRLEFTDDGVLLGHFPGAEGEDDGHDGAEGLGDGGHRQSDGEEEGTHDVLATDQNVHAEDDGAEDEDADGQLLAELVQRDLQGGLLLGGGLQQGSDLAHLGLHAGAGDQELAPAIGDETAGEDHVGAVAQGHIPLDGLHGLFHGEGLAGEGGFCGLQAGRFQHTAVGTDGITGLQDDDVTGNHFTAGDLDDLPVSQDLGRGGRHLLQTVQRGFRLHGLDSAQDGVHGDDRQDDHHTLHITQGSGNAGGDDEDDDQEV